MGSNRFSDYYIPQSLLFKSSKIRKIRKNQVVKFD